MAKQIYENGIDAGPVIDFLSSHHLGIFIANFFENGVVTLDALAPCTDDFLRDKIGMKKAHIIKYRRALSDLPPTQKNSGNYFFDGMMNLFSTTETKEVATKGGAPEGRGSLFSGLFDGFGDKRD